MLYELIIFTMLQPNVEPKWTHILPTTHALCLARKERLEATFDMTNGLIYSMYCELVKEESNGQGNKTNTRGSE